MKKTDPKIVLLQQRTQMQTHFVLPSSPLAALSSSPPGMATLLLASRARGVESRVRDGAGVYGAKHGAGSLCLSMRQAPSIRDGAGMYRACTGRIESSCLRLPLLPPFCALDLVGSRIREGSAALDKERVDLLGLDLGEQVRAGHGERHGDGKEDPAGEMVVPAPASDVRRQSSAARSSSSCCCFRSRAHHCRCLQNGSRREVTLFWLSGDVERKMGLSYGSSVGVIF